MPSRLMSFPETYDMKPLIYLRNTLRRIEASPEVVLATATSNMMFQHLTALGADPV